MRVLVTGGASGLGAAITRRLLAAPGSEVHFTYCASADAAAAIEREHPGAHKHPCDFRDPESVAALLDAMGSWGLDALVNNAVTGARQAHAHKTAVEDLRAGFEHDVLPVVRITNRALTLFRKARAGRVVTVLTSYLVNRPPVGLSAYVAQKAYLASLAKSWAVENAAFGITSACVSPSTVRTGLLAGVDERVLEGMVEGHPLGRLLTAEEVAEAVAYLLTGSPHLTGANLVLNAAQDVV